MRIELLNLILANFKGVQHFELIADGQDAIVSGSNGSGKTSLFDAWLWLLFDMDSRGNKGAEAAKTTKGTDFVHFLSHEVSAVIEVDGRPVKLRKVLEEKWTKKRGEETQTFSGNVSSYWIDDVPTQLKDYSAYINTLLPADLFKILSDPLYFSESMPWKQRLDMLVEISGGISEEEVAAGDRALESLLVKMGDKSMTDYRKMVQEQIRRINGDIDSIPARIDEQRRTLDTGVDYTAVEETLKHAESALHTLNAEELSVKDALKPLLEMQDRVFRLKRDRDTAIDKVLKEANAKRTEMSESLQSLVAEQRRIDREQEDLANTISDRQRRVDALNADNTDMRTKFTGIRSMLAELNTDEFNPPNLSEEVCRTCGQKLPSDMVNGTIEALRTAYETKRIAKITDLQDQLSKINQTGKENAAKIKELLDASAADLLKIEELGKRTAIITGEVEYLRNTTLKMPVMLPAQAEQDLTVEVIDQQIMQLEAKLSAPSEDRTAELAQSKRTIQTEIDRCKSILYAREAAARSQERISELETELKAKATTKTLLEGDIFQCERFLRARTEKLEGKINGMFSQVGFKLFAEQVNGGLSETCEAVVNNTTFSKANTAGQINAGMDIIRTISKYKGLYVPVFVDHLESINDLLPLSSQVISLLVSRDTTLKIATANKQEVA